MSKSNHPSVTILQASILLAQAEAFELSTEVELQPQAAVRYKNAATLLELAAATIRKRAAKIKRKKQ